MPELPEVETIRRGFEKLLLNITITDVSVSIPKILKPPITDTEEFRLKLIGASFDSARRRGKHLIFGLDSGYALYAHLNMRGQMVLAQSYDLPVGKYLCASIRFSTGAELRYHDIWTWGELRLLPDVEEDLYKYVPALATMGDEPLLQGFNGDALKLRATSKRGSPIKTVLLDQSVVAGVGNIYADEALFRSGISPLRKVASIGEEDWHRLAEEIVNVLSEAVDGGGTESDNYVDIQGAVGRYRPLVYGRSKELCVRCATPLAGSRLGGRSTVFCPKCQE